MARALAIFIPTILLGLVVAASTPLTGCSGGGGGPSGPGPGENLCGRITFDNNIGVSVRSAFGCTAINSTNTNVQRDQFGRVTSFEFDITCTAGATDRVTGRVFNVVYDNLGRFVSAQATINGRSCTYSF